MITVYAETTFVLRHARRQDAEPTKQILDASRQGKIGLIVPVLSLFEALYNWRGRQQELRQRLELIRSQADELDRSEQSKVVRHEAATALRQAALKLAPVGDDDRDAIGEAINEIEDCAQILQIPKGTFAKAKANEGSVKGPADALVFALILEHATINPPASDCFFLALDTGLAAPPIAPQLKAVGITCVKTVQELVTILRGRGVI